jgi:hypothetical protein
MLGRHRAEQQRCRSMTSADSARGCRRNNRTGNGPYGVGSVIGGQIGAGHDFAHDFSPPAPEFSEETDSLAEEDGFEPSVPRGDGSPLLDRKTSPV